MTTSGSHRDTAAPEGDGTQILVVEDDADIRALLCDTLATYGFRASGFATAEAALHEIARQMPAAVILDLGLPDMDGMEAINRIRARGSVPILVLSARAHASDRIMGLEFGADDYVVKPFDPREIVARIRSLLRRANPPDQQAETDVKAARFAGWRFEPGSHRLVAPDGEESFLSTGEATLLTALLKAPKRVLTRDHLLEHGGRDDTLDRAIDVRISRIRKKLTRPDEPTLIRTVYGSGYMLTAQVDWS
ncbi:response regulator transcription factor [Stappia stellulata]|uniref:response regulator transcription factor n=1 Tax=Stappia TaxID=152161 RepID=UPI001CD3AEEB|nr:response regulator transcription factor [Stappia stellulata]MCA1243650.1 response regulator transcription factor [Stappia stellulata]